MRRWVSRWVVRQRRRLAWRLLDVAPDPFETLELQARLSRLAHEIDTLGRDGSTEFAVGHHSQAAVLAYDRTLDDACRLVGLPVPEGNGAGHRLLAEATLLQAGWRW